MGVFVVCLARCQTMSSGHSCPALLLCVNNKRFLTEISGRSLLCLSTNPARGVARVARSLLVAHRAGPQISAYLQLEYVKQTIKSDDRAILSGVTGTSPVTTEKIKTPSPPRSAAPNPPAATGGDRRP